MANSIRENSTRNNTLDVYKFIASCFVVMIHCPFPGEMGRFMACVARFAAPSFFVISGYFSYGVDERRLLARMRHLIVLNIWGLLLTLGIEMLSTELGDPNMAVYQGSSAVYLRAILPDWKAVAKWILLDFAPVNGTLWYLMASVKCYGILWCFTRFSEDKTPDYRMLYLAGGILLVVFWFLHLISAALNMVQEMFFLRGALLLGFPMFTLGLFLAQYWQRIWERFHCSWKKLMVLFFAGILLSWMECQVVDISDLHVGSLFMILACMLLALKYPHIFHRPVGLAFSRNCGNWSTGIYLVHYGIIRFIDGFLTPHFAGHLWWYWTIPVWAILISLVCAAANSGLYSLLKRKLPVHM